MSKQKEIFYEVYVSDNPEERPLFSYFVTTEELEDFSSIILKRNIKFEMLTNEEVEDGRLMQIQIDCFLQRNFYAKLSHVTNELRGEVKANDYTQRKI